MLVAAAALLDAHPGPGESDVLDAIGGVLCRCTGYRKIVDAILDAANPPRTVSAPIARRAVGARVPRLDGMRKIDGADLFGADGHPAEALVARAIRSPFHRAGFRLGDVGAWAAAHSGIMRVFTAADVPGRNAFGVIAPCADQPVFAAEETRFKGEAIALVVGEAEAMAALDLATFPVSWDERPAFTTIEAALAADAPLLHADRAGNVLTRGRVVRGDVDAALASADVVAEGAVETGFVEHASIEPEAGCAVRVGDRIEITACTQAPYMDRDDVAAILGIAPEAVRIVPTAAASAPSSISRSSPSLPSPPGICLARSAWSIAGRSR
jgi:CO/xanthine dehydrogenase Mo-binding subunit